MLVAQLLPERNGVYKRCNAAKGGCKNTKYFYRLKLCLDPFNETV